jgi:NAD(P)-dependent dehydrogenase (short-subunit alcohol dehydrogenase family)
MFKEKVAVVTGAARGLGKAIALAFARCGASIVVVDIDLEHAREVAEEIQKKGSPAVAVKADVTDEHQVNAIFAAAVDTYGHVDILVNNAGIIPRASLLETSVEVWDRTMAVNTRSVFLCAKAVLPLMMAQRSGKIINIASVAGKRGGGIVGNSTYAASKGAMIALTKGIAREGAPYGINVNAVAPGFSDTDVWDNLEPERKQAVLACVPLGRQATPGDVANAVCFLASEEASFITGEIMDVDGGLMMD